MDKGNIKNPNWQTTKRERFSYYVYFTGQNSIYTLVTMFLTTYLLFSGVDPAKSAAVLLVVKLWDAINDAVFGVVFDKIKFKSGRKYIPWLRISSALIPIATVLMFAIPIGSSEAVKLAWFAVAYILWDTAYTLCDVPIFGIVTALTECVDERTGILSYKSIWAGIGAGIAYLLGTVLVSENVGLSFWVVALIIGIIAAATMIPIGFVAKERIKPVEEEQFTIKRMFKYLGHNKYLLIYFIGFLFYGGFGTASALTLFASYYLFNSSMFALLVMALSVVPALICALIVPKLIRKFDKMKIYLVCTLVTILFSVVIYLVGYGNRWVFIALSIIRSIPSAVIGVMMFMFTPDCAEYGKYVTGIEAKGITFAIQTFAAKLTAAIAGAMGLFVLGLFGWQEVEAESFKDLQILGIVQPDSAIGGLWFTYALLPAIGCAIAFIIWCFYKLRDKDVQVMADCNSGLISREDADELLKGRYGIRR